MVIAETIWSQLVGPKFFYFVLAFGPLALYVVVIGLMHLSRRMMVVTGERDVAALALALCGLFLVGPVELFFPSPAMVRFGLGVWFAILALYSLTVLLIILNLRPQFVVYGGTHDAVLEGLFKVAQELDPETTQHDDMIHLPGLAMHLRVDANHSNTATRVSLTSNRISVTTWYQLQRNLQATLRGQRAASHFHGAALMLLGTLILVVMGVAIVKNPVAIAEGMQSWLYH